MHAYIRYIHTYYKQTSIHTCMHIGIHIQTYIHYILHIYTYVHTYIHSHVHMYKIPKTSYYILSSIYLENISRNPFQLEMYLYNCPLLHICMYCVVYMCMWMIECNISIHMHMYSTHTYNM